MQKEFACMWFPCETILDAHYKYKNKAEENLIKYVLI